MSRRLLRRNQDGSRLPDMHALIGDSGIGNLDDKMTLNGTTVEPTFIYRGTDANSSQWNAYWGQNMPISGSGADPIFNQPALGNGSNDVAVCGQAGKFYLSTDGSYGNVGTDDMAIRLIGAWDGAASTTVVYDKLDSDGYQVRFDSSGNVILRCESGATVVNITAGTVSKGEFFFATWYLDRSGSGVGYLNGSQGTPASISALGDLDDVGAPSLLASQAGSANTQGCVVYIGLWHNASWMSTHLNAAQEHEAFFRWSGIWPSVTTGTASPNFFTRNSPAYAQKWNGLSYDLINCSPGVPRVDYVRDKSSLDFKGVLIEPQTTNLITYSEDSTQWTLLDLGDSFGAAAGLAPNRQQTMVSLTADSTSGQHGGAESNTPTLTVASYTYSRFFIAGNNRYVWLEDTTIANTQTWFDLQNGTVETEGSSASGSISGPYYSDLGNVYRCSITFTGTEAANTLNWGSAIADGNENFAGNGSTINCYTWGAQIVLGALPSSYIYTSGASVSRSDDLLQYNGDNVTTATGALVCDVLLDAYDTITSNVIATLSDGTSANYLQWYVDSSDILRYVIRESAVTQAAIAGSIDISDGVTKRIRGLWVTDNARQYVDNTFDGQDTSCDVPSSITDIDIGQSYSGSTQFCGRIRNVQIWGWNEENLG